ncbi:SLOG family protein [Bacillus pretiosus]|uniref:SLOG family protein n=1 Tax=Bacillus pretiosus TaxID=2983392 RepID=UPI003D649A22
MPRIIVAGSRGFNDYRKLATNLVAYFMRKGYYPKDIEIVSGTADGADKMGEQFAIKGGCKLTRMPADWSIGRQAGYIRNCEMANYAHEENDGVCFCFWDGKSKGTKHMIDIARRKGLEVHIINY